MKKIKNLVVIQARMGSERFPGKVLLKLGRITVLDWVIRASKKIRDIDDIVVATTSLKKDRLIEKLCINKGVKVFKGQNKDVLSRIYEAVKKKNIFSDHFRFLLVIIKYRSMGTHFKNCEERVHF